MDSSRVCVGCFGISQNLNMSVVLPGPASPRTGPPLNGYRRSNVCTGLYSPHQVDVCDVDIPSLTRFLGGSPWRCDLRSMGWDESSLLRRQVASTCQDLSWDSWRKDTTSRPPCEPCRA